MATIVTTSVDSLRFPGRCVRCGAPRDDYWLMRCREGMYPAWRKKARVKVPVCRACKLRRHAAEWLGVPLSIALLIGVPVGLGIAASFYPVLPTSVAPWFWWSAVIGLFFLGAVLLGNWFHSTLDAMVLGVRSLGLRDKSRSLLIWFRDDEFAEETRGLSTDDASEVFGIMPTEGG